MKKLTTSQLIEMTEFTWKVIGRTEKLDFSYCEDLPIWQGGRYIPNSNSITAAMYDYWNPLKSLSDCFELVRLLNIKVFIGERFIKVKTQTGSTLKIAIVRTEKDFDSYICYCIVSSIFINSEQLV